MLIDPKTFTDRLVEVAPLSDNIIAIDQADDGAWAMQFADKTIVVMEWATEPERIVLSSPLGHPSPDRAEEVYSLALSFSALWRESSGARLGLGGRDGELLLIRELHANTAGHWDLLPVIEHFAYVASWWHGVISRNTIETTTEEDAAGVDLIRA